MARFWSWWFGYAKVPRSIVVVGALTFIINFVHWLLA